MAKPYLEGAGWAIRFRYQGGTYYRSGFPSAAAARKACETEKLAIDRLGQPARLGPQRTCLAVAFQDYARERLPYLKGARQDAQRINPYLRACGLPVIHLEPVVAVAGAQGIRYFEVSLVSEGVRAIPASLQSYRQAQEMRAEKSEQLRRRLARTMMSDVKPYEIQLFINALKREGYAPATIALQRAELRRLFNYAQCSWSWSQPEINPALQLDLPAIDNTRDRILTNNEWRQICATLAEYDNPYVIPAITLLLQTAMRSSELLVTATWANIDWANCLLHLSDAKAGRRDVPLSLEAMYTLTQLKARAGHLAPDALILPTTYEALKKAWRNACQANGIDNVKLHDIRHTAATRYALEYKGNTAVVKLITGHKTDVMVARYVHMNASDVVSMMHGRPQDEASAPAGYVPEPAVEMVTPEDRQPHELPAHLPGNVVRVDFGRRVA